MSIDRRHCLKLLGGSVAGLYSLALLGGCESIRQTILNRPIRRNISTLANNHPIIEAYRDGVAAMKARPGSDRRNWTRQAEIHQNFCPHGNWYFLPWHRAYLFYFESIIRELSGYQEFALPYWNWTCQPRIPGPFFNIPALVDNTRGRGPNDVVPTTMTGQSLMQGILDIPDFETFGSRASTALRGGSGGGYGELEGTPHNLIHGWVGGNMVTFMSPLDPVFWCHHNMIERCWWDWNITQGKSNPNSTNWTDMSLANMFCDKDGNLVDSLTVGVTALMPVLSYQFDDQLLPCQASTSSALTAVRSDRELREFLERGGPSRLLVRDQVATPASAVLVEGRSTQRLTLPQTATRMVLGKQRDTQRVVLRVNRARQLREQDVFVRLFINPPANADLRTADNIYYAGSFAFFGHGDHHHGQDHGNTYYIDITDTVEKLLQQGVITPNSPLNIHFAAVSTADGRSIPRGQIELSGIDILLSEGFEN